jgi:glutathione S-transferase
LNRNLRLLLTDSGLKQPQILALNPKGKVPILITDEGVIYESEPILRYIAKQSPETGLYGSSDYEAALVDQWLKNAAEIDGGVFGQFLRLTGRFAPDEVAYKSSHENFSNAIKFIDDHLALRTYLTGHQVTIADIAFLSILLPAFTCVYTKKDR